MTLLIDAKLIGGAIVLALVLAFAAWWMLDKLVGRIRRRHEHGKQK